MNRFDTEYWVCDVQSSIQAKDGDGDSGGGQTDPAANADRGISDVVGSSGDDTLGVNFSDPTGFTDSGFVDAAQAESGFAPAVSKTGSDFDTPTGGAVNTGGLGAQEDFSTQSQLGGFGVFTGQSGLPDGTPSPRNDNFVADHEAPYGWAYAPDRGISSQELSASIIGRNLAEIQGAPELAGSYAKLVENVFTKVQGEVASLKDPATFTKTVADIFGPRGTSLVTTMALNVIQGKDLMSGMFPTGTSPGAIGSFATGGLAPIVSSLASAFKDAGFSVQDSTNTPDFASQVAGLAGGIGDGQTGPQDLSVAGRARQAFDSFRSPTAIATAATGSPTQRFVWDPQQGHWVNNPAFTGAGATGAVGGTVPGGGVFPGTAAGGTGTGALASGGGTNTLGSGFTGVDPALFAAGMAFPGDVTQSLIAKQIQIADATLQNMFRQSVFQDIQFGELGGLKLREDFEAARTMTEAGTLFPRQTALGGAADDLLAGGFEATSRDIALIGGSASAALQAGYYLGRR